MNHTEQEARELVIEAGHRLLETGLVARTWGNISCRVSDTQFVITPSGRAYDTLRPEQLVLVNIADCSYEGSIKPSSEKGIHAAAYRRRMDVDFVIHTHQDYASCVGVTGEHITLSAHPTLGNCVPCAAYGLPSTKKLQQGVENAMEQFPECRAILMRHHGALCMGKDLSHAFDIATALENISREIYENAVTLSEEAAKSASGLINELRIEADGQHFFVETDSAVMTMAGRRKTLRPYLDDLAQIAGVTVRCAGNDASAVMKAMRGRNAVLVPGFGAVCCAEDAEDLSAIASIVRKGCMTALYARSRGAKPLSAADCALMRLVYRMKYSKKKAGN